MCIYARKNALLKIFFYKKNAVSDWEGKEILSMSISLGILMCALYNHLSDHDTSDLVKSFFAILTSAYYVQCTDYFASIYTTVG